MNRKQIKYKAKVCERRKHEKQTGKKISGNLTCGSYGDRKHEYNSICGHPDIWIRMQVLKGKRRMQKFPSMQQHRAWS